MSAPRASGWAAAGSVKRRSQVVIELLGPPSALTFKVKCKVIRGVGGCASGLKK